MNVNPLSMSIGRLLPTGITPDIEKIITDSGEDFGSFADVFTDAFENAASADLTDKSSALELLAGEADDMSGLLLDAQKAEIALNLALQIRNKALDAYDTVMRMSI
ncbi:MAG: flagellar hook-basal body complex protein FliE [Clostridiales bacterium]|nr:flagellar hook-basal body complex protein FliE [Clostridiales bacterium]